MNAHSTVLTLNFPYKVSPIDRPIFQMRTPRHKEKLGNLPKVSGRARVQGQLDPDSRACAPNRSDAQSRPHNFREAVSLPRNRCTIDGMNGCC